MPAKLRQDSIAGIVLAPGAAPFNGPPPGLRRPFTEGSLGAIVLGARAYRGGSLLTASVALALVLHAGAGVSALALRTKEQVSTLPPITKPAPLQIDHVVALSPPEPGPEPEPQPPTPKLRPPPLEKRVARRAPAREPPAPASPNDGRPPPPAEAGKVVAADEPLDFTSFDISTGNGPRYAGSITVSSGTSSRAVQGPAVDPHADPNRRSQASLARPVGSPRREWACPWPAEADALSIDEQFVVIRVVVREDGTVAAAELISDPGYGFGRIALACARKQRFPAATDQAGRPITATSPPIRVRFTRP